ncbi:AtpZ/AtpI family protein [Mailhella massiliensis]|uniref:AtpZ/AtpI family protein n=1 Tax=Mailhella massiliensis TaxID=1903261 RepID=A0A921AVG7_9BACT|nr:AtpZ/AtpI family protein [Mailhella massiliensis]HJD97080.1 AtpZ/AtpI family protein [Mailhella massiliensis]
MTPEKKDSAQPGQFSLLGTASTMGLHMVSGPVVGGGLGWLADEWLGSWPVGSAIGLLLGLAAGFRNVWIDARYLAKKNAERDAEEKALREKEFKERGNVRPSAVGQGGRKALYADGAREKERQDSAPDEDFTASILAGTAVPADRKLDEIEESLESIRRAIEEDEGWKETGAGEKHEHN